VERPLRAALERRRTDGSAVLRLRSGEKLVFIGDSITHCDREAFPPLGWGFVRLVDMFVSAKDPSLQLEILNRGIGGETVVDLERRWEQDVIAERPDWLFVMIGINDVLFRFSVEHKSHEVDDATYRATLHRLLARTREKLACRIVILEPNAPDWGPSSPFNPAVEGLLPILADLAREFDAELCPVFHRSLAALHAAGDRFFEWMRDIPHPNLKGQALIALALLEHLGW
jgi:lysophospholipase L1-like esterase